MRCPWCTAEARDRAQCPECGRQLRIATAPARSRKGRHPFEGRLIDGCRLDEPLGKGMTTTVFAAVDIATRRDVAFELVHEYLLGDAEFRGRFVTTLERTAAVRDEHVVGIYRHGDDAGALYAVRELVRGPQLGHLVGQRLPWRRAFAIVEQLCTALRSLHAAGVFQRQLSTNEIYLDTRPGSPAGDPYRGTSTDPLDLVRLEPVAGLAILAPGPDNTYPASRVGRVESMAPEVFGGKPPDARSHVYSLGLLAYEMITGLHPFHDASSAAQLVIAQRLHRIDVPSARVAGLPADVDASVMKCLAMAPRDRYADVAELAAAIRNVEA